jgi:hypothetical protein
MLLMLLHSFGLTVTELHVKIKGQGLWFEYTDLSIQHLATNKILHAYELHHL